MGPARQGAAVAAGRHPGGGGLTAARPVRRWLVGGGLVTSPVGVLLVQNRRRDGRVDWSPPGGVIDPGETLRGGLTREVAEETGLVVAEWQGPAYEIRAHAPDMGWELRVEAHVATHAAGAVTIDDPDGIVVDARFVAVDECATLLGDAPPWVAEPLLAWLTDRPGEPPSYSYRVEGTLGGRDLRVVRL